MTWKGCWAISSKPPKWDHQLRAKGSSEIAAVMFPGS